MESIGEAAAVIEPKRRRVKIIIAALGGLAICAAVAGVIRLRQPHPSITYANQLCCIPGSADVVSWSPDRTSIVTLGEDQTARVWDATSGDLRLTLSGAFLHVSWSPDSHQLAIADGYEKVQVWDLDKNAVVRTPQSPAETLASVAWSPDGKRIAAGGDGAVDVWDVDDGSTVHRLVESPSPAEEPISLVDWSPDGTQLATFGTDTSIRLWNTESGQLNTKFPSDGVGVFSLSWSHDGHRVAAGQRGSVLIWDAATATQHAVKIQGDAFVQTLKWTPNDQQIVTSSAAGWVDTWDVETGRSLHTQKLNSTIDYHASMTFSPDLSRLASVAYNDAPRIWNTSSGEAVLSLSGHPKVLNALAWSPDGARVLTGSEDFTGRIWDAGTGKLVRTLSGQSNWVIGVDWSPDGASVATASVDGKTNIWDVNTGVVVHSFARNDGPHQDTLAVAWSGDSAYVATGSLDGVVCVWEVKTGKLTSKLVGHNRPVIDLEWSPDGKRLATAGEDGQARVWTLATGDAQIFGSQDHFVAAVTWSPDGTKLATGGSEGKVNIWDTRNGTIVQTIAAHEKSVASLDWAPKGPGLASTGPDGTVRIWDSNTGAIIQVINADRRGVNAVQWSPEGHHVASAGWSGVVTIHPVNDKVPA